MKKKFFIGIILLILIIILIISINIWSITQLEIDLSFFSIINTIKKTILTANIFITHIESVVYIKNPLFFEINLPKTTYNLMYEDLLLGVGYLEELQLKPNTTVENNVSIELNHVNITTSILESLFTNNNEGYHIDIYADTFFGNQLIFTIKQ